MNDYPSLLKGMPDEQLWERSSGGDVEAFGCIVDKYQSLVCALAYSACGNVARSEDLAQETFVLAWQRLKELRDPGRLRAWLCGIARNVSASAARRDLRRGATLSLENGDEPRTKEADPAAHAISQEEADLLWRSLANLPEIYREPMILFYRQGQSIATVAHSLELTEEAVKQRLSRGRAMLRIKLTALMEETLVRTRPGSAFRAAVMIALPLASASTSSAAAAAALSATTASAATKGILAKISLVALIGPAIGLTCAWLGTRAAAARARSEEERKVLLRSLRGIIVFCAAMSAVLVAVLTQVGKNFSVPAPTLTFGIFGWTAVLLLGIWLEWARMERMVQKIRFATGTTDDEHERLATLTGRKLRLPKYFESRARLLGLPLFAAAWGSSELDKVKQRRACAWIALGDVAISPFIAAGGLAIAPVSFGAISIGVFALSIFWGVALGVVALGSLSCGWWSVGCAALGWKCAVGFASAAREYAIGFAASGNEVGTAAWRYVAEGAPHEFLTMFGTHAPWWIAGIVALALVLRRWARN